MRKGFHRQRSLNSRNRHEDRLARRRQREWQLDSGRTEGGDGIANGLTHRNRRHERRSHYGFGPQIPRCLAVCAKRTGAVVAPAWSQPLTKSRRGLASQPPRPYSRRPGSQPSLLRPPCSSQAAAEVLCRRTRTCRRIRAVSGSLTQSEGHKEWRMRHCFTLRAGSSIN